MSLDFFDCGVRWIATKSPQGGMANVFIDGSAAGSIDLSADQQQPMSVVFSTTGLTCSPHSISVEVNAREATSSAGQRVTFDAFDVPPEKQVLDAASR